MNYFTIITVCLNAADVLDKTIMSVLAQDCGDFEYLIKDGGSGDDTLKIAESYVPAFAEKGIPFRILSQPDRGIYDAMNQAAQAAQGEWVLYMNAGDRFADRSVLSQAYGDPSFHTADVVYGDVITQYNDLYQYKKAHTLEALWFVMPFCHQSVFTKKELLTATPYSLRYRISSDHQFYLRLYTEGKRFAYLPFAISIFDTQGVSSDTVTRNREILAILEEMPNRNEEAIQNAKIRLEKCEKKEKRNVFLRKIVPMPIRRMRADYLRRKANGKTEKEFFSDRNQAAADFASHK